MLVQSVLDIFFHSQQGRIVQANCLYLLDIDACESRLDDFSKYGTVSLENI